MPYEEANMKKYEDTQMQKMDLMNRFKREKKLLDEIAQLKAKIAMMSQNIEDLQEENNELNDIAFATYEADEGDDAVPGANILLDAYALITGPRQAEYAHPTDDYTKVTDIFHAITGIRLSLEEGILFMVSIKLARLRTNMEAGQMHWDSLVDAAGYLGCLGLVWAKSNDPWEPYYEKPSSDE